MIISYTSIFTNYMYYVILLISACSSGNLEEKRSQIKKSENSAELILVIMVQNKLILAS
jgi:hypothetical protein